MSKFSMLGALLAIASTLPLGCEAIVGNVDWHVGAGASGVAGNPHGGAAGEAAAGGTSAVPDDGGAAGMSSEPGAAGEGGAAGAACAPVDDGNPCTEDECRNGVPSHSASAVGTACSDGGTRCDGQGACVACLVASDCPGSDGPCQTRTCAQGTCGFDFAADGTKLPTQTAGDCKQAECDGQGKIEQATDTTDVPVDSSACTSDVCTGNVPSNPNLPTGTGCGGSLLCNGTGVCVGCNMPSDCPGTDTECKSRTCTNNQCGVTFTAKGTAVAAQASGNCLKATCDGAGAIEDIADATDPPPDDGNACTSEACANGIAQHPAKSNGTPCTDGNACTVTDTCQAGTCSSGSALVCAAQDPCHTAGTCNPTTGACSNPAKAEGAACGGGSVCTAAGACVQCLTPSQCPGSDTECQVRTCAGNSCAVSNTGAGTLTSAQTAGDCHQNQCDGNGAIIAVVDTGDVPADDGNQCTDEVCSGTGVASHPNSPPTTTCNQNNGSQCDGSGVCQQP